MRRFGSDRERRRRRANALYVLEMLLPEEGISDFVYDKEEDLFRLAEDGRFAFSREWADVDLIQERGYFGCLAVSSHNIAVRLPSARIMCIFS